MPNIPETVEAFLGTVAIGAIWSSCSPDFGINGVIERFSQIKPKILNSNRRYYDEDCINLLKKVKFLLKEQGMTINGVKKVLNGEQSLELDEMANNSIKADNLRNKLVKISKIVKNLKNLK